jgi:glycopeptide antibiotics resistance protein
MLLRIIKFVFASLLAILAIGLVGYTGIEVFSFEVMYQLSGILFGGFVISLLSFLSGLLFTSAFQTTKYKQWSKLIALSLVFIFYLFVITNLLFTSRSYWYVEPSFNGIWNRLQHGANFVPFKTIFASFGSSTGPETRNLLGNLFLMTPMGFFLPIYIKKLKNFVPFVITMIVGILIIELAQLITNVGIFDIDDLILNLLGAVLFFFLCRTRFVTKIVARIQA